MRIVLIAVNVFACVLIILKINNGYNTGEYIDHFLIDNGTVFNGTVDKPVFRRTYPYGTFFDVWNVVISSIIILLIYQNMSKKWKNSVGFFFLFLFLWFIYTVYTMPYFGSRPISIWVNLIFLLPIQFLISYLIFPQKEFAAYFKVLFFQITLLVGIAFLLYYITQPIDVEWWKAHRNTFEHDSIFGHFYGIEFNFYAINYLHNFFYDVVVFFRDVFLLLNSLCALVLFRKHYLSSYQN